MSNKIFISYRQESEELRGKVLALAEKLQNAGVFVELDQLYFQNNKGGPPEGWPKWCEDRVTQAPKTLIVASPGWFSAYEGKAPAGAGLGAACESGLVRQMLYDAKGINERFRLVFLDAMAPDTIPTALRPWHHYMLYKGGREFDDLLAWLGLQALGQPRARRASCQSSAPPICRPLVSTPVRRSCPAIY